MNERVLLNVKRWKQHPSECAIAAAATLASFYDKEVTYAQVEGKAAVEYNSSQAGEDIKTLWDKLKTIL